MTTALIGTTPGPWVVDCDNPLHILADDGSCSVATVTSENLDGEMVIAVADARLIAAAPTLASAAASAIDRLADLPRYLKANGSPVLGELVKEVLDAHRAALLMAKG